MLSAAVVDFTRSPRSSASLAGLLPMFDPWFAFSWIANVGDDVSPPDWPTRPLALAWLDAEPEAATAAERRFVLAAVNSPYYPR